MTRLTHRFSLALALVALGLWSVSSAMAATQTVTLKSTKGDQATITLNKQTKNAFKKNHIALKTNKPAKRKGNNANFPEKSGKWNFSNTSGNVAYNGVTRFVRGKQLGEADQAQLHAHGEGQEVHRHPHRLLRQEEGHAAHPHRQGQGEDEGHKETVSGFTAKLSKKAASLLNTGLKHKTFKANQKIGSFSADADQPARRWSPTPPAPGGTRERPGASAPGVALAFTPALRGRPGLQRAERHAARPRREHRPGRAERSHAAPRQRHRRHGPGRQAASPAASAGFDDGTLTASVPLVGRRGLSNGDVSATLTDPVLRSGPALDGSSGLYFSLNGGPEIKAVRHRHRKLEAAALPNGTLDLNGLLIELSSELSGTINEPRRPADRPAGAGSGCPSAIVPSSAAGPGS